MKLKIMSFNTQHCLNCLTGRIDFEAAAGIIKAPDADIVGLQEIRGLGRDVNEYADQTGILSKLTGLHGYFGQAIMFGGVNPYGNALLSRYPIKSAETIMIPDPEPRKYNGYYETRCVIKAEIDVPGGLTVLVSHFGLNPDEHENAVSTVCGLINGDKTVLMGDFNMKPGNPLLTPIRDVLTDTACALPQGETGFSFPSWAPDRKIDYIFASRDIKLTGAEIPACVISDHRPHLADIDL